MNIKIIGGLVIFFASFSASADGLKVFGSEYCSPYTSGSCINFDFTNLKDAKSWTGVYKYPKGRSAYDECAKKSDGSDGGLAYCSMVFHREEQSPGKRAEMCYKSVRDKYWNTVRDHYAMSLYDAVWSCGAK